MTQTGQGGGRVFMTPGDVAARLGISGSTFRRISADYETVFGELPRDAQRRRLWDVEAVQRIGTAHEAVRAGQADSTHSALLAVQEGRDLVPVHDPPAQRPPPGAVETIERLDELVAQVERQGVGISDLLKALDERDGEIAAALRALAEAQQVQTTALLELRAEARARPALTSSNANQHRSFFVRLLVLLGIR